MLFIILGFLAVGFFIFLVSYIAISFEVDRALNLYAEHSSVPIDIVFVVAEKDVETLSYSVNSVKKWVKHPINKMVIIARPTPCLQDLAKELGLELIDENTLLPWGAFEAWIKNEGISLNHESLGWYYQQFLKLLYYDNADSEYYFVVDADVVIKKPMVLISDDGVHTYFVGENLGDTISKNSAKKLLGGLSCVPSFSFVADLMCFDRRVVRSLIQDIESRFKTDFYKAALLVEQGNAARFSEYELYGLYANFVCEGSLASYLPKSDIGRPRRKLWLDAYKIKLKTLPYIAYHHYLR
tara:strand:+ start:659 stop:1549 length:891 start_codon:yes stop_codon:yes gene_type:complete